MLLTITPPNAEHLAGGILKTPLLGLGLSMFKKPLAAGVDDNELGGLAAKEAWLGKPTLTSLALKLGSVEITLVECIITVSQERNIVATALQGRDGTVKEYISDGDYSIDVSAAIQPYGSANTDGGGGFVNVEDRYPQPEMQDLLELLKEKQALEVQSDFLTLFGVKSVVVKSYSVSQETHSNRQAFALSLLSDEPFEIKMKSDA
jgi:hypothetical protein